ncbi:MAG TPA: hypothetical protein VF623_13945, partial [Segetibacter sp.]
MTIRKVLTGAFRISIIATSVALVGAATAPFIDPAIFDWPAFLGLMYPFLFLVHIALFVCYAAIRRNKKSLLFLIPVLVTIHIFLNSFGVNYFHSSTPQQADAFTFMTYNVHMFRAIEEYS